MLQRALSQPLRPGIAERALGRALSAVARVREPRISSVRSSY
jgi:hypothetical protein